ncbi:thiamine phosphate synthase [Sphingomicrobium sp. XHP0239]|uniref:thiamine phosphate synthase n=1 Tax=Sphingomicrobium maritimum TaxID=3133972 RepID=UPI0031CC813C
MTDERLGDELFAAIERVPAGGGVLFRHDGAPDRAALGQRVATKARECGLALAVAGDVALADSLDADMVHRPQGETRRPVSLPVHNAAEAERANSRGAVMVLVSPIFATRSHADAKGLGAEAAGALARLCDAPAIALGGMNAERFEMLDRDLFAGWAGIDAFLR